MAGSGYPDSIDESCQLYPDAWTQDSDQVSIATRFRPPAAPGERWASASQSRSDLEELQRKLSKINWELSETEDPYERVRIRIKGRRRGEYIEAIYTGSTGTKEWTYYGVIWENTRTEGAFGAADNVSVSNVKEVVANKVRTEWSFLAKVAENMGQQYLKYSFPFAGSDRVESEIYTDYTYYPDGKVAREVVQRYDPAVVAIGRLNLPYVFGRNQFYVAVDYTPVLTQRTVRTNIYGYGYRRTVTERWEIPFQTVEGQIAAWQSGEDKANADEVVDLINELLERSLTLVDYDVSTNTSYRDDIQSRPPSVERAAAAYGNGNSGGSSQSEKARGGYPGKSTQTVFEMVEDARRWFDQSKTFALPFAGDDYARRNYDSTETWITARESNCEGSATVQSMQTRTIVSDIAQNILLGDPDGIDLLDARFTKTDFILDRPLVDILDDLLKSEGLIGFIDEDGTLDIVPIIPEIYDGADVDTSRFSTSGPLITSSDIMSMGSINSGDVPATSVNVNYNSYRMKKNPLPLESYDPDDPVEPKYVSETGTGSEQARRFGETQNRMLMGHRQGISLVVPTGKIPAVPMAYFYVQGNNGSGGQDRGLYRVNGHTVKFSADGIVESLDAMFWGGVGQE